MANLGIIPARGGSKRIPGKNKKLFCGKPLITYIIEAALKSKLLDTIVVNSDDEDILEIAAQYENIIPIKRPAEISGDKAKAITYVNQTLEVMESSGKTYDAIVILQPTSPLTLAEDIDGTIQLLLDTGADSAVSVVQLDHAIHPIKMKTMQGNKLLPFWEEERGRRAAHELPVIYVRNCSVYASTLQTIREQQDTIGKDCRGYVMPSERSVDINEPVDFEFAEFLFKKQKNV
mgnify:CR=1 FL=1